MQGRRPAQEAPDGAAKIDNFLSMLTPQAPSATHTYEVLTPPSLSNPGAAYKGQGKSTDTLPLATESVQPCCRLLYLSSALTAACAFCAA